MKQIAVEMYFLQEIPEVLLKSAEEHFWKKTLSETFPGKTNKQKNPKPTQALKGPAGGSIFH